MLGSKLAGVGSGDVVADLVEGVADGQLGGDLGDREPGGLRRQRRGARHARVHLDDDLLAGVPGSPRTGRCFRRSRRRPGGCRRTRRRASCWYSTSLSVCAGATVIESPVCTPIGSTFSIEQMITQLSARSRITSSSYSFQPAMLFSIRISLIGLAVESVGGDGARTRPSSRRCRCHDHRGCTPGG